MADLATARALLLSKCPYLARTLYSLIPREAPGLGTLGVTKGLVLLHDPEVVKALPIDELAGILAHECGHVLREHLKRAELGNYDHYTFNVAGDMGINPDLLASGLKLPSWGAFPERHGFPLGLMAEEYYHLLKKEEATITIKLKGAGGAGGKGSDKSDAGNSQGNGDPSSKGNVCNGKCGGIGGNPVDAELEAEVDGAIGRDETEKELIRESTIEDMRRHVAQHGRGSIPGGFSQLLDIIKKPPKVPWNKVLSHKLRRMTGQIASGGNDFSMSRLSKRSYTRGFPRPGMIEHKPTILFCLDTSGSMGDEQLNDAYVEMIGVATKCGVEDIFLMQADAAVTDKPERVTAKSLLHPKIKGRGGTDFSPAIDAARKMRPRPDILIYLTDGDGFAPAVKPAEFEVIWCIVPSYYNKAPVPWGHHIIMADT